MTNKTVIVSAVLGESTPTDHYGLFRNEGRIPINIGFGLAYLGYDVDIIYEKFKENVFAFNRINEINGTVRLLKSSPKNYYDYKLYFNDCNSEIKCKKEIAIINYPHEITRVNKLAVDFVTPYKGLVKHMEDESKKPVDYLPPLNPIPTYNFGFKEFNFSPKNNIIKIFVHICAWEQNTHCLEEVSKVLTLLKYKLEEKFNGFNIKLYIQVNSNDTKRQCRDVIKQYNDFEFIGTLRYDKYLELIEDMDIVIIKGNQFLASGGMYDVIALGKPLLYISEYLHQGIFRNPLFTNVKEIIFSGENELSITRKVDDFINNPKEKYNNFRNCIKDSDFNNWKEYALRIFNY